MTSEEAPGERVALQAFGKEQGNPSPWETRVCISGSEAVFHLEGNFSPLEGGAAGRLGQEAPQVTPGTPQERPRPRR